MVEGEEHKKRLREAILELKKEGYRVVSTRPKIPDAIATKDGLIFAVEMMGQKWSGNWGWVNRHTKKEKEAAYSAYDGIKYFTFRYKKREKKEEENERIPRSREIKRSPKAMGQRPGFGVIECCQRRAEEERMSDENPRTKVNTVKHAKFIEKRAAMARNEKQSGLYKLAYDSSKAWER